MLAKLAVGRVTGDKGDPSWPPPGPRDAARYVVNGYKSQISGLNRAARPYERRRAPALICVAHSGWHVR